MPTVAAKLTSLPTTRRTLIALGLRVAGQVGRGHGHHAAGNHHPALGASSEDPPPRRPPPPPRQDRLFLRRQPHRAVSALPLPKCRKRHGEQVLAKRDDPPPEVEDHPRPEALACYLRQFVQSPEIVPRERLAPGYFHPQDLAPVELQHDVHLNAPRGTEMVERWLLL